MERNCQSIKEVSVNGYIFIFYDFRYGVARHESIMQLRNNLEEFGRMKGANTDEKGQSLPLLTEYHL